MSYFLLLLLVYDCPSRRWYLNIICHGILWPQISGEIIGGNYFRTLTKISVEACAHTLLNPYIWQCSIPVRLYSVLYKQTKLGLSSATTTQPQALSSLLFVTLCIATHILDSVHCLIGQLFVFNFDRSTFPGFFEVFVPWIILYKSNRNNLFVIMFTCSIAFQRYQTWHGNNYLNLINCQAGQKRDGVLVSLHRATSRDVTWRHSMLHSDWSIRWLKRWWRRRRWWIAICWSRPS